MRRLALAAALAFGLAGPAAADYWSEFDAGIEAYIDGRHADAIKRFEPLAARGDHRAQYWLGAIYVEGKGVPRDRVLGHMWFSVAARRGNRAAGIGRDTVAAKMSPEQLAEARRLVAAWRPAD